MLSSAYDMTASAAATLFVWQAAFAIVLSVTAWLFARQQRKQYGYRPKLSKLFYWLSLGSFISSSLPLGFYLGDVFHLEGIWATAVSAGVTLGSAGKAIWDFIKKSKLPDVQKRFHQFVLCLLSLMLGIAIEIAYRNYLSTPKRNVPKGEIAWEIPDPAPIGKNARA